MNRALTKHALVVASILSAGLVASTAGASAEEAIGFVAGIDRTECSVTLTTGATFYEATADEDSADCGFHVLPAEHLLISFNTVGGDNVITNIQRFSAEDAIGQVAEVDPGTLTLANGETFDLEALTRPEPAISVGDYVLVQFTETIKGHNVAASVALANAQTDAD